MQRYDWNYACEGESGECRMDLIPSPDGDWVMFDDASAEIARLRKALVWSVQHGVFLNTEMSDVSPVLGYWPDARFGGEPEMDLCDDSPDQIIATVCRLAEGE